MAVKKKTAVRDRPDPVKEQSIKELGGVLTIAGYEVRREKLKRGHGWQAQSGACEISGQQVVFVDRRLSQDDQIEFLRQKIVDLGLELPGSGEE